MRVTISPAGELRYIWSDDLGRLLLPLQGVRQISRASHVEPTDDGNWTADMGPVGGPVLGPYSYRQDALAAETAWLQQNLGV